MQPIYIFRKFSDPNFTARFILVIAYISPEKQCFKLQGIPNYRLCPLIARSVVAVRCVYYGALISGAEALGGCIFKDPLLCQSHPFADREGAASFINSYAFLNITPMCKRERVGCDLESRKCISRHDISQIVARRERTLSRWRTSPQRERWWCSVRGEMAVLVGRGCGVMDSLPFFCCILFYSIIFPSRPTLILQMWPTFMS